MSANRVFFYLVLAAAFVMAAVTFAGIAEYARSVSTQIEQMTGQR